jgi:hypothetical protein
MHYRVEVCPNKMVVNLLIVGRDGNGKTSTGNSILGQKLFNPSSSHESARLDFREAKDQLVDGREVRLTKLSGLDYPTTDGACNVDEHFEKMGKVVRSNEDGFSAIIIVLKYGLRYTQQERESITMIKSTFGSDVLKDYGVIVLTNGDSFAADMEDGGSTFEDWCQSQIGDFQALLNECDKRVVLFNNRAKEVQILKDQRENLFAMVANIRLGPYTFNDYEKAADSRTLVVVTSALPRLQIATTALLNDVGKELNKLAQNNSLASAKKEILDTLKDKLNNHKEELKKKDKGTDVLNSLFLEMSLVENSVVTKLKIVDHIVPYKLDDGWVEINHADLPDENSPGQDIPPSNPNTLSAPECGSDAPSSENSYTALDVKREARGYNVNYTVWDLLRWLWHFWGEKNNPEDESKTGNGVV